MPHCHICHAEVAADESIHMSSTQLHHVVHNGCNPFTENIRFGLGMYDQPKLYLHYAVGIERWRRSTTIRIPPQFPNTPF